MNGTKRIFIALALLLVAAATFSSCGHSHINVEDAVNEFGRTHPRAWAGTWFGPHQEVRYVAFTSNTARWGDELRSRLPSGYKLTVVKLKYSYRYLDDLQKRIGAAAPTLRSQGVAVTGWGIFVDRNRVHVDLPRLDQAWIDRIKRDFGPAIVFDDGIDVAS